MSARRWAALPVNIDGADGGAGPSRRQALIGATGLVLLWRPVAAQTPGLDASLREAIRSWAGGAVPREGRVQFDIAPLIDNGNAVPVTVKVDSPMTAADHVREIVIFNERNPQRDVLRCQLGPHNGRAEVSARIRLATTQHLVALARMSDGSVWQHTVEAIVTLAACIE
jgi:sulfur-oxidizing protein SoxY